MATRRLLEGLETVKEVGIKVGVSKKGFSLLSHSQVRAMVDSHISLSKKAPFCGGFYGEVKGEISHAVSLV